MAQTFLEKLDPNPENWKIADLTKKYDGLTTACNHYIIVAERIATIQDLEFDANYDPQVAENTAVQFAFEENQSVYKAHLRYIDLLERLVSIHSLVLSRAWQQSKLLIPSPTASRNSRRIP